MPLAQSTRPAAGSSPRDWRLVTRARRPYTFDPITIDWSPQRPAPTSPRTPDERQVLRGPIHPHLLKLKPGDPESFAQFVENFGILEFLPWLMDQDVFPNGHPDAWRPVIGTYEVLGQRTLWYPDLEAAWTDPMTQICFTDAQDHLRSAYRDATEDAPDDPDHGLESDADPDPEARAAHLRGVMIESAEGEPDLGAIEAAVATFLALTRPDPDPDAAAEEYYERAWWSSALKVEFWYDPPTKRIVEQPAHIFARGWLELADLLEKGGLTRTCPYCGNPFAPRREKHRFCSHECQQHAHDKRANQTPERRAQKRNHMRRARAALGVEKSTPQASRRSAR